MGKLSNKFKFVIPAELQKADDGEWKVKGLASTDNMDLQGEVIIQKGIDLTPIERKRGVLNWDHNKGPENTIGLLDGYTRTGNGLYVEGRLFRNHSRAKSVKEIMESLKGSDRGRMGMSVEGKILERDPQNPKVIKKCQINAVALTMNPVNTSTFADLVKSFNSSDIEFNSGTGEDMFSKSKVLELIDKALSVSQDRGQTPPVELEGGSALEMSNMESKDKKKKKDKSMKPLKKTTKEMYKSSMISVLDQLQTLYPNNTRSELWEAFKERLQTRFPDICKENK